jgi:hypothetical protein
MGAYYQGAWGVSSATDYRVEVQSEAGLVLRSAGERGKEVGAMRRRNFVDHSKTPTDPSRGSTKGRMKSADKTQALGMSKWRFLFLNAITIMLICGQLFALAIAGALWPFSNYSMFATLAGGTGEDYSLEKAQLYGVMQEEPHQEIALHYDYIKPFEEDRLSDSFANMQYGDPTVDPISIRAAIGKSNMDGTVSPEQRQRLLNEACHDFLVQYEMLRRAGYHDGPPLRGIRLYQLQWQLDPHAQNVVRPDHRELLAEYERPQDD